MAGAWIRRTGAVLWVALWLALCGAQAPLRAAGPAWGMDDPELVTRAFYAGINEGVRSGSFRTSYGLLSRAAQKRRPYKAFSQGFATTRLVTVDRLWVQSQSAREAVVQVGLTATDEIGGALQAVAYDVTYTLVWENRQWRMDRSTAEQPPEDVVRAFCEALDRGIATGDLEPVYKLMSADYQAETPYEEFIAGFETARRVRAETIRLLERGNAWAAVGAVLDVADETELGLEVARLDVTFTLAREGARWRVDEMEATPLSLDEEAPWLLYAEPGSYHIGDETLRGWRELHGECWAGAFELDAAGSAWAMELELFGADGENNVWINERWVATLPSQPTYKPDTRPNWWSERVTAPLWGAELHEGWNTITICAAPLPDADDADDMQMRNIRLLGQTDGGYQAPQPAMDLGLGLESL